MKVMVGVKRVLDYHVRVQINPDESGVILDEAKMRDAVMARILVIAEHDGCQLNIATARTIACALEFKLEMIDVAIFTDDAAGNHNPVGQAALLAGVTRVQSFQGVENNWLMIKRIFFSNMQNFAGNMLIFIDHLERAGPGSYG